MRTVFITLILILLMCSAFIISCNIHKNTQMFVPTINKNITNFSNKIYHSLPDSFRKKNIITIPEFNLYKSPKLYSVIDSSDFLKYINPNRIISSETLVFINQEIFHSIYYYNYRNLHEKKLHYSNYINIEKRVILDFYLEFKPDFVFTVYNFPYYLAIKEGKLYVVSIDNSNYLYNVTGYSKEFVEKNKENIFFIFGYVEPIFIE